MAGVTVGERTRLSLILMRRGLRRASGRVNNLPLMPWRLIPRKSDRLLLAPQDLRTADGTRASEIYSGRFAFAGKVVICDGRSAFELNPPSEEWAAEVYGFGWLRHLRAADSAITRANARALVDEWISLQGSWHVLAWRSDVLSRRVISWISQAPLILQDVDAAFYRRFMRSLTRQVRFLRHNASEAREGAPHLQVTIALMYATLCMASQERHVRGAAKRLSDELDAQVLPDGGHISRNPGVIIELLLDLLPLKQAFSSRNMPPPPALLNAIDRMMPMLRFFRHDEGSFALFNGMGPTATDLIATILAYDDVRGEPVSNAPHSGYQRLRLNNLLVLMDTGAPPPMAVSQEAHAGCLAFEFCAGGQRIVVNCGVPSINKESWRQVARATPAHSTVTFNNASSCMFREEGAFRELIGVPIIDGPSRVALSRNEHGDSLVLRASHDGYGRFGVIHQRAVMLTAGGSKLEGEDVFMPTHGEMLPLGALDEFAIRFHLHPSVKASRRSDGHGAMLVLPNKDVWTFDSHEDRVELEESVYLGGSEGPRRTVQLVIHGRARQVPRVHWTFTHAPRQPTPRKSGDGGGRKKQKDEPELPL
ncbi:MAG: heparinase II/III family protein [Pseudorhodoplanes sp.]|uniref:heparinase II/III family protein n=1 Tax=Pseudorhodoplanes sp. TaxID=1934341 RepID=UPI003D129137